MGKCEKQVVSGQTDIKNPFTYAGYMQDDETDMYYLIARYYNPEQGVFISADPDPGDDDDPITQNGYTYVSNNPVSNVDEDGNKKKKRNVNMTAQTRKNIAYMKKLEKEQNL
ncbi:RHS repeat-associated core domain-containing protein [Priestia megaterium]